MNAPQPRSYAKLAAGVIVAAALLRLPALEVGFSVDDYAQLAMMKGVYPVERNPLALFSFSTGAQDNETLRATGFFPWWSDPDLRISMFRPLASALMWLDLSLFDLDAYWFHVHSMVWWLVLAAAFAALARLVLPKWPALLALGLFLVDESHTMLLGWIASRNAVIASAFGMLGLVALMKGRGTARIVMVVACFAVALAAGEYALCLLPYALLLERQRSSTRQEPSRLWLPLAGLVGVYFVARAAVGAGAFASGMYLDPVAEPVRFVREAMQRLPLLTGDIVLTVPARYASSGTPWVRTLIMEGLVEPMWATNILPLRALLTWIGIGGALLGAVALWLAMRGRQANDPVRALAIGTPLALLPVAATLPDARLLAAAAAGWSIALAAWLYTRVVAFRAGKSMGTSLSLAMAATVVACHLFLPISSGQNESLQGAKLADAVRRSILDPHLDVALQPKTTALLVSAADPTTTIYVRLARAVHGRPAGAACHLLSVAFSQQELRVTSPTSFELTRLTEGFTPGDAYAEVFNNHALRPGQHFRAGDLQATVERTAFGRPTRTRFELNRPLHGSDVVLLAQTAEGLRRLPFPKVGRSMTVPQPLPPLGLIR